MRLSDDNFLTKIGLGGLPLEAKARLRKQCGERLDLNVEMRIKGAMNATEHARFDDLFTSGDVAGAFAYLKMMLPEYQAIVDVEILRLQRALSAEAPAILAVEMAFADVQDLYEKRFSALDGCKGQEPPLAS